MIRANIQVDHVYSAKRPKRTKPFGEWGDRQVLRIVAGFVQFDSPTVRDGAHYPTITMQAFLHWAKEDVTDKMPENGEWRR